MSGSEVELSDSEGIFGGEADVCHGEVMFIIRELVSECL